MVTTSKRFSPPGRNSRGRMTGRSSPRGISPARVALATLAAGDGLYRAGIPGYTSNFSRDSLIYGFLADDIDAIRAQLEFSARHQGRRADPSTGEEPGKIHHEYPGVRQNDLWTTYDACDTTALFLVAIADLAERGQRDLLRQYRDNVERALEYVSSHLIDDVFHEDSRQANAERFALTVTYWKDSELNLPVLLSVPGYPIAYSLVHFQYAAALRALGDATGSTELAGRADVLVDRGLATFWQDDHFRVATRGTTTVADGPSSDSLHALLYLDPGDIGRPDAMKIVGYSEQLVCGWGYLPALPLSGTVDPYHTRYVWVHEQALLHEAARRHGLDRPQHVAARILPAFDAGFPELVDPTEGPTTAGNPTQLWAVGAYLYFERQKAQATHGQAVAAAPLVEES
jgi:glycogen debranching enzyme